MRVIPAEFFEHSFDGIALTVHFCFAILFPDNFRTERDNLFETRVNDGRTDGLQVIGELTRFSINLLHAGIGIQSA